jgi:hypothetical protein
MSCKKSSSSRWYRVKNGYHCSVCQKNSKVPGPIVKRSTIKYSGNGLYADRDYGWNTVVTTYGGNIYANKDQIPKDRSYVVCKNGVYINGKFNFGSTKGRYMNNPPKGTKANCTFGNTTIGHFIQVKTVKKPSGTVNPIAVKKGQEFFIKYGSGYWRRSKTTTKY